MLGIVTVKKFDTILKPYITRINKQTEILAQLVQLKKQIFEKDFTISDFFRLCQN